MTHQDISKFILDRLSAAGNREDLIRDVCYREGLQWPEGEALVSRLEAEDEQIILRRQSPIALVNSLMFSLAGMLFTAIAVYILFWPALGDNYFSLSLSFVLNLVGYGYKPMLLLLIGLTLAIWGMISFFDTLFQLTRK
jgi:hypothetical protein